jgi:nickel-dependent lactate racemase
MNDIELGYGKTSVNFTFDEARFSVLANDSLQETPLSDPQIGAAFDSPISSAPLDEIVSPDDSVLIVVSDATRATGSAQVVNLLVRRLIQHGVSPGNVAIIFATGIHRPVAAPEMVELLTPFITQRIRTLTHDAYQSRDMTSLGVTRRGIKVEVNRALKDFSRVILTGGVGYHYFAGFTGGRKSVCPGLASAETIESTHMLALDFDVGGRRAGVGPGRLDGNAVHEECDQIAELVAPAFGINAVVEERGRVVNLVCGDWRVAHRVACDRYLRNHSVAFSAKREVAIVSCGGLPYDINLIQAHKALEMASYACKDGGSIILLAECKDGLGRPDFLKWFAESSSRALEDRLRNGYEVNGQTAWSLLTKAERFRVYLVSDLPAEEVTRMRLIPARSLDHALEGIAKDAEGFILPRGAAVLPRFG